MTTTSLPARGPTWVSETLAWLRRVGSANEAVLVAVLVALSVAIGAINPAFWSLANLSDIARSTSFTLIVAVAACMILIGGQLDLSVGSVYGLAGIACGLALTAGVSTPLAIVIGLACGSVVGLLNAWVVVWLRVPALIATLGTLYAARGLLLVVTQGQPVYGFPEDFLYLGQGTFLGLPVPVWAAAIVLVVGHIVLSRTGFGRRIYAVGSNVDAAYLAGVPIRLVQVAIFVISSLCAAFAGILVAARISSSQVNSGTGLELAVVAAVIIGGTSLFGGSGSVLGSLLGCLLLAVISNGMVLSRIDPFYQNIVVGIVIIVAVAIDGWRRRRLAER